MLYLEFFFFFVSFFSCLDIIQGWACRLFLPNRTKIAQFILVRLTSENRTFSSLRLNSLCSVRLKAQTDWFMEISIEKDKEKPKLLTRLKLSRAAAIAAGAAAQEQPQPLLSLSLSLTATITLDSLRLRAPSQPSCRRLQPCSASISSRQTADVIMIQLQVSQPSVLAYVRFLSSGYVIG